ncbi:MAG TPA: BamA/TamA family outer membrane protein [Bryobacteraceae bacterium]|nr:BamA/TamA family outer membrane protein [Bryobacteraceae bacterium]
MKFALFFLLIPGMGLWARNQQPVLQPVEFNVNSQYTVEAVEVPPDVESHISGRLRRDLQELIGQKLNPTALNDLARRMREELHVRDVTQKVLKGSLPGHVRVVMEVGRRKNQFDLSVPKFLYHSSEGWSADVQGALTSGNQRVVAGLVSDGDELAERFAGLRTRYEDRRLGTDRLRLRFEFDTYHEQWNPATREAIDRAPDMPGIYRTRQNFEPVATIVLAKPLTLSFGAGFQNFDTQFPAARTQSANAAITTLRYERHMEETDANQQELAAAYSLRAATRVLNSDFVYARHRWELRYSITRGRHTLTDEAVAGFITGRAPLFERYVLGTSSLMRGWNKYDLDPLGGSRLVHNSLDYRYGMVDIFYDIGAIWDAGQDVVARHSIGVGLRKNSFLIAMAFPIKEGRVTPTFMVGMNY